MCGGGRAVPWLADRDTAQPRRMGCDMVGSVLGGVGLTMDVTRADIDGNLCIGRVAGIAIGLAMMAWLLGVMLLMPRKKG